MSLRLRLTLMLGSFFVLLWLLAAAWMLQNLHGQMMRSLDGRLEASAHMVASLFAQLPHIQDKDGSRVPISAEQLAVANGMACQVSSLRGEVLLSSQTAPDQALEPEAHGFSQQVIEDVVWRTFTLVAGNLRITTADKLNDRDHLNRSVLFAAALPVLVALLGSLALLWFCVGQGLKPLQVMREALTRRDADSLHPLQMGALAGELQPLVDTQNQLFARIAQTIERERRFSGDAAHELRSPLTAIKTHLQVARMVHGEDDPSLAHAEAGADRLQRTLEQLLLLARVEGSQDFNDGMQGSAEDVARMAIADIDPAQRPRVVLQLAADLPAAPIQAPVTLVVSALRNLLENALRHSSAQSPVEFWVRHSEAGLQFCVSDRGPGMAREQIPNMTRRFWRKTGSDGSGLGLSIVEAIAERCGGSLVFSNRTDGLEVTFSLPESLTAKDY